MVFEARDRFAMALKKIEKYVGAKQKNSSNGRVNFEDRKYFALSFVALKKNREIGDLSKIFWKYKSLK